MGYVDKSLNSSLLIQGAMDFKMLKCPGLLYCKVRMINELAEQFIGTKQIWTIPGLMELKPNLEPNIRNICTICMITHYHMSFDVFLRYGMFVAWGVGVIKRKMRWHPYI